MKTRIVRAILVCIAAAFLASAAYAASAEAPLGAGDVSLSSSEPEAVTATASRIAPAKRVQLRVVPPPASSSAVFQRAQRAVFDAYVRTHPDVELVPSGGLSMQGGAGGDLLAIAGGVSPDVFSLYFRSMHSYIEQGFVMPLDEYLDNWDGRKDVPPQLWPVATGRDGYRYGAIYNWPTSYLIYRRDLFREAGLDPKRPPQNWDELYADARRLSRPDMRVSTAIHKNLPIGRFGLFLPFNSTYTFANFIWEGGGEIVRQRDDGKWEAIFDQAEGVRALEYFQKMRWQKWTRCECGGKGDVTPEVDIPEDAYGDADGFVTCPACGKKLLISDLKARDRVYTGVVRTGFAEPTVTRESRYFARGEVAMVIMPLHRLQDVAAENIVRMEDVGVAPLPAGPTGIRASMVDGDIWCVASRLEGDKERCDAAWEFIRFMTSEEAQRIETRVYVESGFAKFLRNPHWLEKFGYRDYFNEIDPQQIQAYDEALKYGRPEPYAPDYSAMENQMAIPLSKVVREPNVDAAAELRAVVKMINTHFYKLYPEDEMRFKRRVFAGLAVVAVFLLGFAIYQLVKALADRISFARSGMSAALKASRWKHLSAWIFLAPAVLTILVWAYIPVLRGSGMALQDYKIFGEHKFVGLDNFIEAFGQPLFWKSLFNTFQYSVMSLSLGFLTPIILSLFLSEVPRLKITFRVLFYLPALTSGLVIMFLWKDLFYDPTAAGVLNRVIANLAGVFNFVAAHTVGLAGVDWHIAFEPQKWLQDPKLAMVSIILPSVWAGAGPGSIIYLAALKTVPEEMYEAAEIDGAGPAQKIRLLTLPYLKPLILINFIGAFIGTFHATQNIFVMTMGGPENATHTLSLEIWFNAFLYLKFGYATAMAWIMGSMLIGFTLYQLRIFQKVQFTAGGTADAK